MQIFHYVLVGIQVIVAIALVLIIAVQTTKSEQSGGGMGWGTIGGQATTSIHKFGLEAQLTRVTTWLAVGFIVLSFVGAVIEAHIR